MPDYGVIKDIVGIWGLQVTIMPPHLARMHGPKARQRRTRFRKHLRAAMQNRNAILQDYITPVAIPDLTDLFTEFSLVCGAEKSFPYARLYKGRPEHKIGIGDALVRIER